MVTLIHTNLPNSFSKGKVRDTYSLNDELLLMIATDRISAFDIVLPDGIPDKGKILTSMSCFWFEQTNSIIKNHFVSRIDNASLEISKLLPEIDSEIAERSIIIKKAERIDIECIARGYLTGSVWAEYRKTGTINSQPFPDGLQEGFKFDEPLFTPTTKADSGHDEPLTIQELSDQIGNELTKRLKDSTINLYNHAEKIAGQKGIIIADTKLEFGFLDDELILIDEILTPDSSRFWDKSGYEIGTSPPNFDKQFVRDWLVNIGWDKNPPAPNLPPEIVDNTRHRYLQAHYLLTGKELL